MRKHEVNPYGSPEHGGPSPDQEILAARVAKKVVAGLGIALGVLTAAAIIVIDKFRGSLPPELRRALDDPLALGSAAGAVVLLGLILTYLYLKASYIGGEYTQAERQEIRDMVESLKDAEARRRVRERRRRRRKRK